MYRIKHVCILLLFATTLPTAVNAQTDATSNGLDITALFEKETARKIELEEKMDMVASRLEALEDRLGEIAADSAQAGKKAASAEKKIKKLKGKREYLRLKELVEKRDSLLAAVKAKTQVADKILCEIQALDKDLTASSERREELEAVKESVGKNVLADYGAYPHKPFSEMDLQELERIMTACSRYADNKDVKAFMEEVELTIENKQAYDNATDVLQNRFDIHAVNTAINRLKAMKGCNETQRAEAANVAEKLGQYEGCFNAVRDALKYFNENKRSGKGYTKFDWNIDRESEAMKKAKVAAEPIPYLKEAWKQFVKAMDQAPDVHSDIEQELLGK